MRGEESVSVREGFADASLLKSAITQWSFSSSYGHLWVRLIVMVTKLTYLLKFPSI